MIFCISMTIIHMYSMDIYDNNLALDLLYNTITSNLVSDETYFVMYNLIAKSKQMMLHDMQQNMQKLEGIMPSVLGVGGVHCLDRDHLKAQMQKYDKVYIHDSKFVAFSQTIQKFQYLIKLECPLSKIDVIFRIFTEIMVNELREFWSEIPEVTDDMLYIDSEDLKKLMIYI